MSGAPLKSADWERIVELQPKVDAGAIDSRYHAELGRLATLTAPRA